MESAQLSMSERFGNIALVRLILGDGTRRGFSRRHWDLNRPMPSGYEKNSSGQWPFRMQ